MSGIRKVTRHCGRYGISAKHIQVSYFRYTEPKRPRGGKQRKYQASTPKQRNLNDKRSRRYFEALVLSNFVKGDLHITTTYDEEHKPKDLKKAKKNVENFIKRVNYEREKKGLPSVKYVCVTEEGGKTGRIHHHFIMDGQLDRDTVESKWGMGYCNADRIQPDKKKELAPLIGYLSKDPKGRKRWSSSHNLVRPWDTVNDDPRMMSGRRMELMKDLPEDSEAMKKIIEDDNPGYELDEVEKEYREEIGQWYFFCRMKLKSTSQRANVDKSKPKKNEKRGSPGWTGEAKRASPPP